MTEGKETARSGKPGLNFYPIPPSGIFLQLNGQTGQNPKILMLRQIRITHSQMVGMVPGRLLHHIPESRQKDLPLRIDLAEGDGIFIFPAFFHLGHSDTYAPLLLPLP